MAIWMMCDKTKAGQPNVDEIPPAAYGTEEPIFRVRTHDGLVISLREMNGYDDSDFYALVWNWEKGEPEEVMYASTRGWTYPNFAVEDATPEVMAAYEAWRERRNEAARLFAAEREAKTVAKGKRVRVVRGRKVPRGTEGEVIWLGQGAYGPRCGIRDDAGTVHWTATSNVDVVLPVQGTDQPSA